MKDNDFRDSPSVRFRVHVGIIGILIILAAGFLAIYFKIEAESLRSDSGIAYLAGQVGVVNRKLGSTPLSQPIDQPQTPAPGNATTYKDSNGYGFDVPAGYTAGHSATAQFEQWAIVANQTDDQPTPLPEMIIISRPEISRLSSQSDLRITKTEQVTVNGLIATKYLIEEVEGAACPVYEFILNQRTYRIMLHECLDSKIFDQVAQSFRHVTPNVSTPGSDVSLGQSFSLAVGQSISIAGDDGLFARVNLIAINDSRCKPGVQCIWQGELAAEVKLTRSKEGEEKTLNLGKLTKSCADGLLLDAISETQATFVMNDRCE